MHKPDRHPTVIPHSSRSNVVEALENRQMLAAQPFGRIDSTGALVVSGSGRADVLTASIKSGKLRIVLNGKLAQFTASAVRQVSVSLGNGNDKADLSAINLPVRLDGGAGNDTLIGGGGNDTITAGAGADSAVGNNGNDRIYGGADNDVINGGNGEDILNGEAGDDKVYGGNDRDRATGGDGNDYVDGQAGNDILYGGAGNDSVYGGAGRDAVNGEAGDDHVYGGDGNDTVTGGPGRDYIYGDAGDDTLDSADGVADRVVDGGTGTNTVIADIGLDSPIHAATITAGDSTGGGSTGGGSTGGGSTTPGSPTATPVGGDLGRALSVSEEALWDENFNGVVAKLKSLGVKAVRLWLEVNSWDERPHAWDTISNEQIIKNWKADSTGDERSVTAGLAMRRAIDLKAAGFNVILTVNVHGGVEPTSAQQVKDLYSYLESSTRNQDGTGGTLKDAVDMWEVGQEIDLPQNWAVTKSSGKAAGLKSFVDEVLIPAATVLHSGPGGQEKVISPSVSYSPSDVSAIMSEVKAQNSLDLIDYIGYHPYGRYLPDQNIDEITPRVNEVKAVAKQFGDKPIAATEWNVRGYATDGSQDAKWASAVDYIYRNDIAPNFGIAVYYSAINNYAARGGNPSARPSGVFEHNSSLQVTPDSSVSDLESYLESPLVANEPFYSTVAAWYKS